MKGYTLIELIVFILITSFTLTILIPIVNMSTQITTLTPLATGQQLAQARMDLILAQRYMVGFPSYSDPCAGGSPPAMCTAPSGFCVSASIANNWSSDTDYNVITVIAYDGGTGSSCTGGTQVTELTALVSDYNEYE